MPVGFVATFLTVNWKMMSINWQQHETWRVGTSCSMLVRLAMIAGLASTSTCRFVEISLTVRGDICPTFLVGKLSCPTSISTSVSIWAKLVSSRLSFGQQLNCHARLSRRLKPAPGSAHCASRGSWSRPRTLRCFLGLPNITNKMKGTLFAHKTSGCIRG